MLLAFSGIAVPVSLEGLHWHGVAWDGLRIQRVFHLAFIWHQIGVQIQLGFKKCSSFESLFLNIMIKILET